VGKLFGASLKMLYRDGQALFFALAFPVIFAVIFGLFDFGKPPTLKLEIVGPPSPVHRAVEAGLRSVSNIKIHEGLTFSAARRSLFNGDITAVIMVPAVSSGGGGTSALDVYYNASNGQTNGAAQQAIERVVDGLDLRLSGVSAPPLSLDQREITGHSSKYYDFLLPGLVGLGVMTFSITALAVAISRFREQRILKRILATPLPPRRFVTAQVLARLVLAIVQAGLILAIGVLLFHAHVYGNLVWVLLLVALGNLVFLNIGFLIAGRASGPDAAQGIAQAITLPMMFLSGVFFPTDTLPTTLQKVVHFLPLTPLLDALRKVVNDGRSITATGHQVLLLAAWGMVTFILAARTFRFADA